MLSVRTLVYSAILAVSWSAEELTFPPGFKFGVASAAYQVEGGWNASDKGESIWDRFTHTSPSAVADGSSGDVACDSYHLWREDVRLVADLGADFYRFSISWARLLPTGFADHISEDGTNYYNHIIDGLLQEGIEPVVTLYHYDLPQSLQDLGGWSNPLIAEWFAEYARVAYSLFGARVRTWLTISEPWRVCDAPYLLGQFPPGLRSLVGAYLCSKHVLMAHASAWRLYDQEFRTRFHGQVSLAQRAEWAEPASDSDRATARLIREYQEGRFSHPVFTGAGGWPPAVERALAMFSQEAGLPWSVLPTLTQDEITFIKGTYDFYALNFYESKLVSRDRQGARLEPWPFGGAPLFDRRLRLHTAWAAAATRLDEYTEGLRKQLSWVKAQYGDMPVLVTSGRAARAQDHHLDSIDCLNNHMRQVLLSIQEDEVNVTGFAAGALLDGFQWTDGYTRKFGLYEVEFSSPLRTRTPRASAQYYGGVIRSRSLDLTYNFTNGAAPKSSKPQDNRTNYIIFGGLILVAVVVVVVVGIIAAVIGCRVKIRARLEKHKYSAVKNGAQNGDHNDEQHGGQPGAQNGNRHGTGVDASRVLLTT